MGVNIVKLASLFESRSREENGQLRFLEEIRSYLGLSNKNGTDYKDQAGNKRLGERSLKPEDFSLRELAEGILGPSFRVMFDDSQKGTLARVIAAKNMVGQSSPGNRKALFESTGFGIDPTAFLNINTFTSVVGGLIEVKILEAFQNPQLIADKLCPAEPTKLNGQKMIGIQSIGDRGKKRLPGEAHTRAQFGERWVLTPETRENALAVDVTKEAVFFDYTGDVLNMASSIGLELSYRKELEVLGVITGATNSFNYNGTAYNTYQTSKTLGYLNDFSNPLIDWTSIQADMLAFMRTEDPHTGKRILLQPNTILVNPAKLATANLIINATSIERRTGAGATTPQTTSNPLFAAQGAGNPYGGQFEVLTSPLLEQICTASAVDGGLALSQANADEYWWMLQSGKSFKYMQNYPLTITQAAPNQYEMLDKGLVASYFANERGIAAVVSPWHIIRNKN
jgi:hypothetical protein